MIGSVSAGRRVHAFAELLEASRRNDEQEASAGGSPAPTGAGGETGVDPAEQAAMASVVHRLTALPRPALTAEAKATQRARLLAELESSPTPAPARGAEAEGSTSPFPRAREAFPERRSRRSGRGAHRATPVSVFHRLWPRSRLTKGLAAGGLTMGVAAGALGGAAAASTDALPGDTLYGLKRGMEDLRLDFASGDADRGRLYLDHASTRLNEARRLMERGRAGPLDQEQLNEVRHALSNMCDDASEGHHLLTRAWEADGSVAPMRSLSDFAERHRDTWAQLRDRLPVELFDVSSKVSGVFNAMEADVAAFQPLLPQEPSTIATTEASPLDPTPSQGEQTAASQPPASTSASARRTTEQTPRPEASLEPEATSSQGLLGDTGLLDTGIDTGLGAGAGRGSESSSGGPLGQPEVTIPPLVEDLLPELGLGVDQSQQPGDTSGGSATELP